MDQWQCFITPLKYIYITVLYTIYTLSNCSLHQNHNIMYLLAKARAVRNPKISYRLTIIPSCQQMNRLLNIFFSQTFTHRVKYSNTKSFHCAGLYIYVILRIIIDSASILSVSFITAFAILMKCNNSAATHIQFIIVILYIHLILQHYYHTRDCVLYGISLFFTLK